MKALIYLVLAGCALLVAYLVFRRKSGGRSPSSRLDPTLFGNDTTAFQSQLDSRLADAAPTMGEPVHRGLLPPATTWNAQVFRDIEWRRFEAVCANLFAQPGSETRCESHGAENGMDIWLCPPDAEGPAAVVRCGHWLGRPVGVDEMREFRGVMASHKFQRATFATTGSYTVEARDFAKSSGITALDGIALLALISRRTAEQQKEMLRIAYEGEYWRPTCANCGLKMVERSAGRRGGLFWGCADHPRCEFTLPVRTVG
jgi:restriction system protein